MVQKSDKYQELVLMQGIILALFLYILTGCDNRELISKDSGLYAGFQNPPAEARPFVRWWWNGNKVNDQELERELELLKSAGFGGVEINPIALPKDAVDIKDPALVWMSDEWIDRLVVACKKAKDLNMIVDLIVGTGWPFGGEFLEPNETTQRMVTHYLSVSGGTVISVNETMLTQEYLDQQRNSRVGEHGGLETTYSLSFVKLVPEKCSDVDQVIDLMSLMDQEGQMVYKINQPGNFQLSFGLIERGFRKVYLGAPGGAGPVMDHYKKEVTRAYLSRLKKIAERTGIPLSELIRALFCDSIEIAGANWTDDFAKKFLNTYGYSIDAWLPFIFYPPTSGYLDRRGDVQFSAAFKDELKKVRFDYNNLLVELFLTNFTQEFKDFCAENNLLCRYQAYGTPFLMGLLDGYLIPDIPESNNWIYSAEMKDSLWQWNQHHGYMIWNMYAAAGGHLAGRKIISSEAMTNTKGVFRTTLEEIKQHDDMNFITGMNHTILHGFNYSPPEVEFPGWIRYGSFFSELNPWWKHIDHWVDYNARLSYLLQNSQPEKSIAIVGPTHDLWGEEGLGRSSFHVKPAYLYKLWEPISQFGYSCEYINQKILENASTENGVISYGQMNYHLLILASLKSITPKATTAIQDFVESGGKVVVIDHLPDQASSYIDHENNGVLIKDSFRHFLSKNSSTIIQLDRPDAMEELDAWTNDMLLRTNLAPDLKIDQPSSQIYQIHQKTPNKEIYFFTNVHRYKTHTFTVQFPIDNRYPWRWDPETGGREPYYYANNPNELSITLAPLESLLLVFEGEKFEIEAVTKDSKIRESEEMVGPWRISGKRVDGKDFDWQLNKLIDFGQSADVSQSTFAGEIRYQIEFENADGYTHIDLGNVNEGVTQLYVNGQEIGTRWYGQAIYPIAKYLNSKNNEIEIRYTTVLANYCHSLTDNRVAQTWSKHKAIVPTGMEGPVRLIAY